MTQAGSSVEALCSCPLCANTAAEFVHGSDDRHGLREFYNCLSCDLTFVPPKFHLAPSDELERYNLHDNDPADPDYRRFLSRLWDVIRPELGEGSIGLDYGCGPGPALAAMIRESGFDVELYDLYFFPDEAALRRSYDFVTCTETVEHLRQPMAVFSLLDSLLKSPGTLGIMTGIVEDTSRFGDWYYQRDPTHIAFYSRSTFEWIGERMGWSASFPAKSVVVFRKPPL